MTLRQRLIYGAMVTFVVFFLGEFVFGAGTLLINLGFGIAMGAFAIVMVTLAARIAARKRR
ncbi:MAG: hypothetical protein AAFV19_12445 [Pseudomonadota bacterium]